MSRLNVGNLFNENEDGAPVVSGISTFSSPYYFVPPSGSTAQRPSNPGEGMIRFNTDSGHLEYYTGELWVDVIVNNQDLGDQNNTNSTGGTGTRGLFGGGGTPSGSTSDVIQYITIDTLGDAQDFGDLSGARNGSAQGAASRTRAVFGGGSTAPTRLNIIETVEFASTGDATDFGDLTVARAELSSVSNQTRGVFLGGSAAPGDSNEIDYITISSRGNAVDWGVNLPDARERINGAINSSVRGLAYGGSSPTVNTIDFITINTTGTHGDFGDINATLQNNQGGGNCIRGIINSSGTPAVSNQMSFVTIATLGDSQDFGDLVTGRAITMNVSSSTRLVIGGGMTATSPAIVRTNVMEYVTIASTGNAVDFGDMTSEFASGGSSSNGHGGL
jgi:hypothetical protein